MVGQLATCCQLNWGIICLMPLLSFSPVGTEELKLRQELSQRVLQFQRSIFADSTKSTYRTYRNSYFRFCRLAGYESVPATTTLICQYAAFARTMKATSVRNYLNIIILLHKQLEIYNPLTNNWPLKSLMIGIKRVKDWVVSQKLPITPYILVGIHNKLNLHHSFDATFWAICFTAVYGLFRKFHLHAPPLAGSGSMEQNHTVSRESGSHPPILHSWFPSVSLQGHLPCLSICRWRF